jgi:hypothetical protein
MVSPELIPMDPGRPKNPGSPGRLSSDIRTVRRCSNYPGIVDCWSPTNPSTAGNSWLERSMRSCRRRPRWVPVVRGVSGVGEDVNICGGVDLPKHEFVDEACDCRGTRLAASHSVHGCHRYRSRTGLRCRGCRRSSALRVRPHSWIHWRESKLGVSGFQQCPRGDHGHQLMLVHRHFVYIRAGELHHLAAPPVTTLRLRPPLSCAIVRAMR